VAVSELINAKVAECLDMAFEAREKAKAAQGKDEQGEQAFWKRMEQRWLHLAQTYRETEQLTQKWLAAAPARGAAQNVVQLRSRV
jgi:hypothetical protein